MTTPAPSLRIHGGANMLGMKAVRLPNISTHVTLSDAEGKIQLKLPLPDFDWIAHDDVVFVTLGMVKPFLEGLGAASEVTETKGGIILPRAN